MKRLITILILLTTQCAISNFQRVHCQCRRPGETRTCYRSAATADGTNPIIYCPNACHQVKGSPDYVFTGRFSSDVNSGADICKDE